MMKSRLMLLLMLAVLTLAACKQQPRMIPLGGAPDGDHRTVARIKEGSMLLRGLDRKRLELGQIPNPFSDAVFAVLPGRHDLLTMNIQSGHLIPTENMRCYIIEAELKAGVMYRLDEDKQKMRAVLVRDDSGAEIASASVSDRNSAFGNPCDWK